MDKENLSVMTSKLVVYFEEPFWVGVFERVLDGRVSVCKVTFGAEPKDYEILEFIQREFYRLNYSPSVKQGKTKKEHVNPKRQQRDIKKQVLNVGIGTKSQQALKLQQEQKKIDRKIVSRQRHEEEQQRLFVLKQQKRKEKHKGR